MEAAPTLYNEDLMQLGEGDISVEAGSNTCAVTLRVIGGDGKGSLKSETVNMITSPKGVGPEKDYAGEGQQHIQKTDSSYRQRGRPHKKQDRNCQRVINIFWGSTPRLTD
jgi:hypothetical protein